MSIITASIPVPTTGEGALVDVSTMIGPKTVVFTGRFQGVYELLGSHDDSHFLPILQFDAGGVEGVRQTISGSFKSMRLRAATPATSPGSGVTCEVSAVAGVGQNYFATIASLAAGATPGLTPTIDLLPLFPPTGPEDDICFLCEGGLAGQLVVLGSLDGVEFCPVGSFRRDRVPEGAPISAEFSVLPSPDKIRYVRLSLDGAAGSPLTVTVGGRVLPAVVTPPVIAAWWPLDEVAYFILDGDDGNDANVGYIIAPPGSTFTPAQTSAVAIKTTDRLEEVIPPYGAGRGYVILAKPRAGRAIYDAAVEGDALGGFQRDLRTGYSLQIMRGSDLTNSTADRLQLGMVTAYGPFTVASTASDAYGTYAQCTVPIGVSPVNMGKYRVRASTAFGTFYAAAKWGSIPAAPDPNKIYVWTNSWGPLAPGNTVWLEEPGVRLKNFYETTESSILPSGPATNNVQLAGVEVGASDVGEFGQVHLGCNVGGGRNSRPAAPPTYCCVRSVATPPSFVGSLAASDVFVDETGTSRYTAYGIDMNGCTCTPGVDQLHFGYSHLENAVTIIAAQVNIESCFVLLLSLAGGSEGVTMLNVIYQQMFLNTRMFQAEGLLWIPDVYILPPSNGINLIPSVGAPSSFQFRGVRVYYAPQPDLPSIRLYYGQYDVVFNLDYPLTAGTGVALKLDAAEGPAETLVTYDSLAVTGFEVEGAQKVICTRSGLGYPANVLPCPRGVVMQMVDGVAGTAHPVGLVATAPAATPARFDLALSDDVNNMRVIGATLTNVVQGDAITPGGWAVVGCDGLMVLRQEVGSTNPTSGDNLYLSELDEGCVSTSPPVTSPSFMLVGRAVPIGPNATSSGVVVPTAWEPEQPVTS